MERRNVTRGFKKLRVWNNAVNLYILTCQVLAKLPFELKRTAGNCIDCSQSISRNEELDKLHYQIENELIQLIKSIQNKIKDTSWNDGLLD